MTTVRACILVGIIWLSPIRPLSAQQQDKEVAERVAPVARQLAGWHHLLAARKSLSLVALKTGHVEPGFGHDDSPDFTGTFQLFYKGDRFLYSVDFIGAKGTIYDRAETFDGDCYKSYDRRGETLTVSSKRFLNDIVMCQGHALFMPFLFLQSAFSKDAFAQLSYAQLTSKEDWENALVSIPPTSIVQEVTLENQSYLKVTGIGKNIDPASDGECLFDVYFAKGSNWYPTKWEGRSLSGVVVASFSVDEIGLVQLESGESIPYPKRAIQKHYTDGKLRDTERIEVKQISFDSVSDEDLAIDATPAKYIRDLDNGGKLKAVK